jgi:hypothetical protein
VKSTARLIKYDRGSIAFHRRSAIAIIAVWPIGTGMVGGTPPSRFPYSVHVGSAWPLLW